MVAAYRRMKHQLKDGASVTGFGIIADDLTGAMDTGVGFIRMGLDTILTFSGKLPPEANVIVISTDSRGDDPRQPIGR